jgi:hypothetical protein
VARVGAGAGCSIGVARSDVEETCGSHIALLELPMSQTKGLGTGRYGNCGASNAERASTSTYKCGMEIIGERSCGTCGVKGYYTTTCPMNPNRSRAIERKGVNRVQGGRGRLRMKMCYSAESNDDQFVEEAFAENDDYSDDE